MFWVVRNVATFFSFLVDFRFFFPPFFSVSGAVTPGVYVGKSGNLIGIRTLPVCNTHSLFISEISKIIKKKNKKNMEKKSTRKNKIKRGEKRGDVRALVMALRRLSVQLYSWGCNPGTLAFSAAVNGFIDPCNRIMPPDTPNKCVHVANHSVLNGLVDLCNKQQTSGIS